jgi:hypothetical protein
MQTCIPETREIGTVGSMDVALLLASRYGLMLKHQDTIEIVRALSGDVLVTEGSQDDDDDDRKDVDDGDDKELIVEEYLDIVQLTSILLNRR